jgi:hypothetical protein
VQRSTCWLLNDKQKWMQNIKTDASWKRPSGCIGSNLLPLSVPSFAWQWFQRSRAPFPILVLPGCSPVLDLPQVSQIITQITLIRNKSLQGQQTVNVAMEENTTQLTTASSRDYTLVTIKKTCRVYTAQRSFQNLNPVQHWLT